MDVQLIKLSKRLADVLRTILAEPKFLGCFFNHGAPSSVRPFFNFTHVQAIDPVNHPVLFRSSNLRYFYSLLHVLIVLNKCTVTLVCLMFQVVNKEQEKCNMLQEVFIPNFII